MTRGRGVVVHLADCSRILNLEEERRIDVEWETLGEKRSPSATDDVLKRRVTIRVVCRDEPGLLSVMTAALTSRGVNITQAHCRTAEDGTATNLFDVMVLNAGQLGEALRAVGKIEGVMSVERVQA